MVVWGARPLALRAILSQTNGGFTVTSQKFSRVKRGFAVAAAALGAVLLVPAPANAFWVSDSLTCPSGRYVKTTGSAHGYLFVRSGNKELTAGALSRKHTSTPYSRTVHSYWQSATWFVSSGANDSEMPGYSNNCSIN